MVWNGGCTVGVRWVYGDANGLNSLVILFVRSHEIWDLGIHQNNKKHREPAPSMAHQVYLISISIYQIRVDSEMVNRA